MARPILRVNQANDNPGNLGDASLKEVDNTRLSINVEKMKHTGIKFKIIKLKIQKVKGAFIVLGDLWKLKDIKYNTKLGVFNSSI